MKCDHSIIPAFMDWENYLDSITEKDRQSIGNLFRHSSSEKLILVILSFHKDYTIDKLLKITNKMIEDNENIKIIIYGEGNLLNEFVEKVFYFKNYTFLGEVTDTLILKIMSVSDAVVFPFSDKAYNHWMILGAIALNKPIFTKIDHPLIKKLCNEYKLCFYDINELSNIKLYNSVEYNHDLLDKYSIKRLSEYIDTIIN